MHSEMQRELENSPIYVKTLAELNGHKAKPQDESTHGDSEAAATQVSEPWPILAEDALYGLVGDIVRAINPYTEADPVAVLVTILVMFGNVIGPGPHFRVEFTKHFLRFFVSLVGRTAKGRKGQSLSTPRHLFQSIDPDWVQNCLSGGLSSGEGLIYQVRDPRYGISKDGKEICLDNGVADKRLLLIEEELAGVLKVATREGNSLSSILRQAWDKGDLRPLTKNDPIRATGSHISVIGHVTEEELLRHLTETEQTSGFGNRFLWCLVRRSKVIPRPKGIPEVVLLPLLHQLQETVNLARKVQEMDRDAAAEVLWEEVYPDLSEGKSGLFGAIIARAEAQVMRLACLYTLLDSSSVVKQPHLTAALALWDYCEESARLIFGDALGNPIADEIYRALLCNQEQGLTRTDFSLLFGRNRKAAEISLALNALLKGGKAWHREEATGGKPAERWFAGTKKTKLTN